MKNFIDIPDGVHAWHFRERRGTLASHFGRNTTVAVGRTNVVRGELVLCRNGLHASFDPVSAFSYVDGRYVSVVDVGGQVGLFEDDKFCVARRTVVSSDDLGKGWYEMFCEYGIRPVRLRRRLAPILDRLGFVVHRGIPMVPRLIGTPELRRFLGGLNECNFIIPTR